jgi:hypothetical protein
MARPNPIREESSTYVSWNNMKKQRDLCWTRRKFGLKFGAQSLRLMVKKMTNHELI